MNWTRNCPPLGRESEIDMTIQTIRALAKVKAREDFRDRLAARRRRLKEAGRELMEAALDQGWPPEYMAGQFALVAESGVRGRLSGELHDSTCEYACAFQAYYQAVHDMARGA